MTAEDKYTNTLLCTYQYLTERAKKENDYESVLKICKKACGIAIKAEIAGYVMDFYEYEADAFYNMGKMEEALDTFYEGFLNLKNLCENPEKQCNQVAGGCIAENNKVMMKFVQRLSLYPVRQLSYEK